MGGQEKIVGKQQNGSVTDSLTKDGFFCARIFCILGTMYNFLYKERTYIFFGSFKAEFCCKNMSLMSNEYCHRLNLYKAVHTNKSKEYFLLKLNGFKVKMFSFEKWISQVYELRSWIWRLTAKKNILIFLKLTLALFLIFLFLFLLSSLKLLNKHLFILYPYCI